MKTIEMIVYKFHELDENVQRKIVENWRDDDYFFWSREYEDSLDKFIHILACAGIDIKVRDFNLFNNYISYRVSYPQYVEDLQGERLRTWIINNIAGCLRKKKEYKKNGKTRKSNIFWEFDEYLTGYYVDHDLLLPFLDAIKYKGFVSDMEDIVSDSLNNWITAYSSDYFDWLSEERIIEDIEINDYDFYANGKLYFIC